MIGTPGDRAVARITGRRVRRSACAWGAAFGLTAAASATTYATTFPTAASRAQLVASTSRDRGLAVLLGPASEIGSVGGYTVYKGFVFLTTIAALWALFATTRALRGEEDEGRWHLLLSGGTSAGRATAVTLGSLAAAVLAADAIAAVILAVVGRDPDLAIGAGAAARYGASLGVVGLTFVGIGGLSSQLARTRRGANGLGAGAFAVALVVRMVADSGPKAHWLRWATPFGWAELMRPLTEPRLLPVVPAIVSVGLSVAITVHLVRRRDVGAGSFTLDRSRASQLGGVRSTIAFTVHQERWVLTSWLVGLIATGLFLGVLAGLATASVPDSMQSTLERLGVRGSFLHQYLGVSFLLVATVLALVPAGQVGASADEELSGRAVHLFAQPVDRGRWLAQRLLVATMAIVVGGLLAGGGAWLGARARGLGVELGTFLGAGLNTVPPALVALGGGALAFALVPRRAASIVYVAVVWSMLADIVAPLISGAAWLRKASLFHAMALVPAQSADPVASGVMLGLAVLAGATACLVFRRRDLRTA